MQKLLLVVVAVVLVGCGEKEVQEERKAAQWPVGNKPIVDDSDEVVAIQNEYLEDLIKKELKIPYGPLVQKTPLTKKDLRKVKKLRVRIGRNEDGTGFFSDLANLENLESVYFEIIKWNLVTNEGMEKISNLQNLKEVEIRGQKLLSSLDGLAKLPKLERLYIIDCAIDDQDLPNLMKMKKLKSFSSVRNFVGDKETGHKILSKVTSDELEKYNAALPNADIGGIEKR